MTDGTNQPAPEAAPATTAESAPAPTAVRTKAWEPLVVLGLGTYFGVVLTKSEVVRWKRVHDMFLFREAHMYLIIGVAIVVAMISMRLIKWAGLKTITGQPITYKPKPYQWGVIIGGTLFGAGWAITGACPGPIYAQVGGGEWMALCTLIGALLGTFAYAILKPRLPH